MTPALAGAHETFQAVVEGCPDAIVLVDDGGCIALINRSCESLLGYARDELIGKPLDTLVPHGSAARHAELHRQYMQQPSERRMGASRDLLARAKDGAEIPVEIGLNPIRIGERQFVLASLIDITRRKRDQALIERSLAEKEVLLREIHHRVKNNLQVISSILKLQADATDNEAAKSMFDECCARIRSMAMIHDRLYRSVSLASIDFGEHVRELASTIVSSFGERARHIRILVQAESVALDLDAAVPIGLIVNELVTNALKYAFAPDTPGTIRVRFAADGPEHLLLVIGDDGVGMDAARTSLGAASTLGLRMVRSLTRQLKGRLEIDTQRGTEVRVRFPRPDRQSHAHT